MSLCIDISILKKNPNLFARFFNLEISGPTSLQVKPHEAEWSDYINWSLGTFSASSLSGRGFDIGFKMGVEPKIGVFLPPNHPF